MVVAIGTIPERVARVGVAFAPTDEGRSALREAASLAARCGATVRAISVAGPLPWMDVVQPEFEGLTLPELYGGHLAYELEAAASELPRAWCWRRRYRPASPPRCSPPPAPKLDLLVCGSHGYGPLGQVVLESTSSELLEQAGCPVLIVPRATLAAGPEPQARASQSRSLSA